LRSFQGQIVCDGVLGVERDLELTSQSRSRLEDDFHQLSRERNDLLDRLNSVVKQKNSLAEESVKLCREVEKHAEATVQTSREKENLAKEKAELSVRVAATERENRQLGEVSCCVGLIVVKFCRLARFYFTLIFLADSLLIAVLIGGITSLACLSVCLVEAFYSKTKNHKSFSVQA